MLVLLIAAGFAFAGQKDKAPPTYDIPLPARPDFSVLDWLVGEWVGHTVDASTGKETPGDVHLTISYTLDKRFLLVHEDISLPAGKTAPALHEVSTGFLSADRVGTGFVLRVFSSTGFISEYHVTAGGDRVTFDPQGGPDPPPGFLFRRLILRLGPGSFSETVEVAPPGRAFFPYYAARLGQVLETRPATPPASASPAPPSQSQGGAP
jgi:hypothetical protein